MALIKGMRLATELTAINVLVGSGFSIVGILRPQYLLPAGAAPTDASLIMAMYAAASKTPLALFVLAAIYNRATTTLLYLGALAGTVQLLDGGIGLYEHDPQKAAGPIIIAVIQLLVVYRLYRSVQPRQKPL